jgi:hypothetical protein
MSITHQARGPQQTSPTRRLSARECRDWLTSHREGRLGYHTGRGPRSVVVSYAVADEQIMFRLPDYNDIVHYAPGERVTLEVESGRPVVGDFGTVRVTGEATLAPAEMPRTLPGTGFEEQWPAGVSTTVICLPLTEVEGFEQPDGDQPPPTVDRAGGR